MQNTDKKDIDETKFEDEVERVTLKHCGDKTLESDKFTMVIYQYFCNILKGGCFQIFQ